jgi:hypothetical protein
MDRYGHLYPDHEDALKNSRRPPGVTLDVCGHLFPALGDELLTVWTPFVSKPLVLVRHVCGTRATGR